MGEIGYLIVAIIIIVASVIGKLQEQKKAQELKKKRKPVRPEDLPEATRRLLYGTPDKPPAESRTQPPQVRTAQPRTAEPYTAPPVQRQRPQETRRPVPMQPQVQSQVQHAPPPPPPPRVRKRTAERQQMTPETSSLQNQHARIMAQRKKQLQEAQAQHAASLKKTQQMQRRMTGRGPRRAPTAGPSAHPMGALFSDLGDLRRGIVMMEVLGRPKAFE